MTPPVNSGASSVDDGAARQPVTESSSTARSPTPTTPVTTTPTTPVSASFYARSSPVLSLARGFSLHGLGFSTSPLGALGHRISFYGDNDGDGAHDSSDGEGDGSSSSDKDAGAGRDGDQSTGGSSDDADGDSGHDNDPIVEDRKDVLIDRLNDIIRHIEDSHSSDKDENVIGSLHAHIDEMEAILATAEAEAASSRHHHHRHHHRRHNPRQHSEKRQIQARTSANSTTADRAVGQSAPMTLGAAPVLIRNQLPSSVAASNRQRGLFQLPAEGAGTSPSIAFEREIARRCDELADALAKALASLAETHKESEEIQHTVLRQLDAAKSRTADLEAQVKMLTEVQGASDDSKEKEADGDDDDYDTATERTERGEQIQSDVAGYDDRGDHFDDVAAELSFLRLQLRALEVRCGPYMPDDADPELAESIANWKADWSALRAQVAEERTRLMTMTTAASQTTLSSSKSWIDMNSTF